ncbi:Mitochondrial outer membrane protein porin [Asimina triloba]
MNKGPVLFSEIGKKAKDLLTRDYSYDQKFSVSTYSNLGVGLTSTVVEKGGLSNADIAAQYKYRNINFDVKVDTESKLEAQYSHEHATFTTIVALKQSPVVDLTGTVGTPTFALGAEAGYDTSSGCFTKYNAGLIMTKQHSTASVIIGDKGDTLTASFVHDANHLRSAGVAEVIRRFSDNENTVTVGASYGFDHHTTLKARLNNHGQLAALLQHQLQPKSLLTVSGEFDTKGLDKTPKIGVSLALKP